MTQKGKDIFLRDLAYARSGDKGKNANIGVIAYNVQDYPILEKYLTKEKVFDYFVSLGVTEVIRYELPNLGALNFVLKNVLGEGGSCPLRIDAQGKTLGQALLEMRLYGTC